MALMDMDLTGKVALVTAATSGIGLQTSEGLARQGAHVWLNSRSQERLDSAVATIRQKVAGAKLDVVAGDVSTEAGIEAVTKAVPDVDILVNVAGGTHRVAPFLDLTDEDWYHNWDFNVMSGVRLTRFYAPKLQKKNWGRVVFISSEAGINIPEMLVNYGVCKAAVIALSRSVAEMFAGTNITCNCVIPGPTVTDWVHRAAESDAKSVVEFTEGFMASARPTSLLKRFATADEVANLILYVCSPASSATSGAALRVEGGILRHW
jgi:NAD(P)-dependent dehydrogenase (short-subunit alcohol dehydrogenase family)